MKLVEVEAFEDRTRPEGGHAVIVVRGIASARAVSRFRLRPIDSEGLSAAAKAFFEMDHTPLRIETKEDGLALSVGPEIADNPGLVPGAAVEITLPDADARGELLWPAVTPLARPKRRNIMTRRAVNEPPTLHHASVSIVTAVRTEPDAQPAPVTVPADRAEIETREQALSEPAEVSGKTVDDESIAAPNPRRQFTVRAAKVRPLSADEPPELPSREMEQTATPATIPATTLAATLATVEVKTQPPQSPPPEQPVEPRPVPVVAAAPPGVRARSRGMAAGQTAAFAVAVLVAAQLLAIRTFDLRLVKRETAVAAVAAPESTPATLLPDTGGRSSGSTRVHAYPGIYDVIAAGPQSPRGIAAGEISPARALQMAHGLLHGQQSGRDWEEGIYWLKRYVLATAGAEHSRIALTQLGSAYAQPPAGAPDFARAIVAWELAGALGDPVAMCFLAAMHDLGLGVPAAKDKAETWFARASTSGNRCATGPTAPATDAR